MAVARERRRKATRLTECSKGVYVNVLRHAKAAGIKNRAPLLSELLICISREKTSVFVAGDKLL